MQVAKRVSVWSGFSVVLMAAVLAMVLGTTNQSSSVVAAPGGWTLDKVHTAVYFKIDHLGMSYTYGRFNEYDGTFSSDPLAFDFSVAAKSVDTHHEKRDDHIRNADFLNVKQFPVIRLESKEVTPQSDGMFEVMAHLTLHGVTKPVTMMVKKMGEGDDPWGNTRIGYSTEFTIDRTDFGMDKMIGPVGKEITLMISWEGTK